MQSPKHLNATWRAYELALMDAHSARDLRKLTELADTRADLIRQIEAIGGLVRCCNVFWLDGDCLEIGEPVEYRASPGDSWRAAQVGEYAASLVFEDGSEILLLDVPDGAEMRRVD